MNKALEVFLAVERDDSVVPIWEATERNGEYTEPFSLKFKTFDDALKGGIREGDLVIITGLSGSGKTTFAQNLTLNLSNQGLPCLWFSYEVIIDNLWAKFKEMGIEQENLVVYTPKRLTSGSLDWIKKKIVEAIDKNNCKFIFIDHLDFLSPTRIGEDQRRIVLRDICAELKTMAIELRVSVFLMAHVKKVQGREVEMQDIAESSGIYQLSDLVFAINRDMEILNIGGKKLEVPKDSGIVRILKNRLTGQQPFIKFILHNNIIEIL